MRWFLPALLLLAATSPAAAQVCVSVDTERDMLTPREQRASVLLVSDLLVDKGLQVTDASGNCDRSYRLYHVVFGDRINVTLSGPEGSRHSSVDAMEDVPRLYSQLVNALLAEQPLANSNATVDRRNVTWELSNAPRVEAEGLWFLRLGGGGLGSSSGGVGPALGFGYRHELDTIGIEASFLEFVRGTEQFEDDLNISYVKLMGLRYLDPHAGSTAVFGAGVSWSQTKLREGFRYYDGNGVQLHARMGYDLLRASTIRMFVQGEVGLPLYTAQAAPVWNHVDGGMDTDPSGDIWAPTFTVSFGIGWVKDGY